MTRLLSQIATAMAATGPDAGEAPQQRPDLTLHVLLVVLAAALVAVAAAMPGDW